MVGPNNTLFTRAQGCLCSVFNFFLALSRQWRRLVCLLPVSVRQLLDMAAPELFPLTNTQINRLCDAVLASVDEEAVRALASRHSDGLPCEILSIKRGSYNLSICLDFYNKIPNRVLRIPLQPAVRDGWTKVQSEAATIEYIQTHTSIPVPRVLAYGNDGRIFLNDTAQPYLLCEFISGHSVGFKELLYADPGRRIGFFSGLVDIYAQLFRLRFPAGGSLMPSVDGPRVGGLLTVSRNELQLEPACHPAQPQTVDSAQSYVQHQLDAVAKSAQLPLIGGTLDEAREQVFALHYTQRLADQIVRGAPADDPFVLAHPDLHYANIIVDDNLAIQGLIDWEFTTTVPRRLFVPPAWATGHSGAGLLGPDAYPEITGGFGTAVAESAHDDLKTHWGGQSTALRVTAEILARPSKLERLFYDFLLQEATGGDGGDEALAAFFAEDRNDGLAAEAERRWRLSQRYTEYLKATGLYADMEEEGAREAEIEAKMRQLLKKYEK